MTSFATELATPSVTNERTLHYMWTPYRVSYIGIKQFFTFSGQILNYCICLLGVFYGLVSIHLSITCQ